MTVTEQAKYLTEAYRACKLARETKRHDALQRAAELLDSDKFDALPVDAQNDLTEAYAAAMVACSGALMP